MGGRGRGKDELCGGMGVFEGVKGTRRMAAKVFMRVQNIFTGAVEDVMVPSLYVGAGTKVK
jgi:hypothetical protein